MGEVKYLDYEGLKYYHNKSQEIVQKNKIIQESSKPSILVNNTNNGTTLKANIDNSSIIQDSTGKLSVNINLEDSDQFLSFDNSKLKANVKLKQLSQVEINSLGDQNILEAYSLVGNNDEKISNSDIIKIYKDSSVHNVAIGQNNDTIDSNGNIISGSGSSETTLNIVYHLEDGTYKLAKLALGKFLEETEFGNGLEVVNHVAQIQISSSNVKDSQGRPILNCDSDGLRINGSSLSDYIEATVSPVVIDADSRLTDLENQRIDQIRIEGGQYLEKEKDDNFSVNVTIPLATESSSGALNSEDKSYLELLKVAFNLDSTKSDYKNSALQTTSTKTSITSIANSDLIYSIDSNGFIWSNNNDNLQSITPNSYTLFSESGTSLISSEDRKSITVGDVDNQYGYFNSKQNEVNIGSQDYQVIINEERSELEEVLLEVNDGGAQINDREGNTLLVLNQSETILKVPQEITTETDENQVVPKRYVDSSISSINEETKRLLNEVATLSGDGMLERTQLSLGREENTAFPGDAGKVIEDSLIAHMASDNSYIEIFNNKKSGNCLYIADDYNTLIFNDLERVEITGDYTELASPEGGIQLRIDNDKTELQIPQTITDTDQDTLAVNKKYVDSKVKSPVYIDTSSTQIGFDIDFARIHIQKYAGTPVSVKSDYPSVTLNFLQTEEQQIPNKWSAKLLICNESSANLSIKISNFTSLENLTEQYPEIDILKEQAALVYCFKFQSDFYYKVL